MAKRGHIYTQLKIFGIIYLVELLVTFLATGAGYSTFTEPAFYIYTFVTAFAGFLLALLLNALTKHRRIILFSLLGHFIAAACILVYVSYQVTQFVSALGGTEDTTLSVYSPQDLIKTPDKQAIEKVIYHMEEEYPLGAYELNEVITDYINRDTTGNSGLTCAIVFTLKEEGNKKYISKYYVKADSFSVIYLKKDTLSPEYRAFLHSNSSY